MNSKRKLYAGFISPLDCFIHVAVSQTDQSAWISTFVHEFAHYLQLISTPVGVQIRTRQVWLASDMALYLHSQPQPIAMGEIGHRLIADTGYKGNVIEEHLKSRLEQCQIFNQPFPARKARTIYAKCFPSSSASDEEAYYTLRKTKPLDVECQNK